MKKLILALVMLVAFSTAALAKTEAEVKAFRSRVEGVVRTEGYAPSLDEDGDIKFKKEGRPYWISVESYQDGYYVTLYGLTTDDATFTQTLRAMNEAMREYKFVRLYAYNTSDLKVVKVSYSWYCTTLAQFEQMFDSSLLVVSAAYDYYENEID